MDIRRAKPPPFFRSAADRLTVEAPEAPLIDAAAARRCLLLTALMVHCRHAQGVLVSALAASVSS